MVLARGSVPESALVSPFAGIFSFPFFTAFLILLSRGTGAPVALL